MSGAAPAARTEVQHRAGSDEQHTVSERVPSGHAEQFRILAHAHATSRLVQPSEPRAVRIAEQRSLAEPDDHVVRSQRRSEAHAKSGVQAKSRATVRLQHEAESVIQLAHGFDRAGEVAEPPRFVVAELPEPAEGVAREVADERGPTPVRRHCARFGGWIPAHPSPRRTARFEPLDPRTNRGAARRARRELDVRDVDDSIVHGLVEGIIVQGLVEGFDCGFDSGLFDAFAGGFGDDFELRSAVVSIETRRDAVHRPHRSSLNDDARCVQHQHLARRVSARLRRAQDVEAAVRRRDRSERGTQRQSACRIETGVQVIETRVAIDDRHERWTRARPATEGDPREQDAEAEQATGCEAGEERDRARSVHTSKTDRRAEGSRRISEKMKGASACEVATL